MNRLIITIAAITLVGCQSLTGIPFYSKTDKDWLDMLGRATAYGLAHPVVTPQLAQPQLVPNWDLPVPIGQLRRSPMIICFRTGNIVICQ